MSDATPTPGHLWRPIEAPPDPGSLERHEMRALERLWRGQREHLEQHGAWKPFWEKMARWWSIETGVIEGVFDVTVGTTLVLVAQGFVAALIPHGEADRPADEIIQILGDHRAALEMVMDVVGGTRSLSVGWIKELHALLCAHQEFADAVDQFGRAVKIPLTRGAFKTRPNHVTLVDGSKHECCPPEHVAAEMDRLVEIYRALPEGLPEVRSSWLHHAFTQVHPFEDGNGRVARALASIDFIRANLFPLLIRRQDRTATYVPALARADRGELGPLVQLFCEREERVVLKAISEAELAVLPIESMSAALDAANSKLARRKYEAGEARDLMMKRFAELRAKAEMRFAESVRQIHAKVDGASAKVFTSDPTKAHWFRAQIVEEAKRNEYWADLRNPWDWVRLQMKDGGLTDLVVILHFVGNPSPGTAVAIAFVTHRGPGARKATATDEAFQDVASLGLDPLALYPDEDPSQQAARFSHWLTEVEQRALALWVRYL